MLYTKYNIDIKNIPVYYIWDRDSGSNEYNMVKKLLLKLNNSYGNDNYENGLLLLSYPCCESYVLSCFEKNKTNINENIKTYLKNKKYRLSDIDNHKILKAVVELIKNLGKLNVKEFNIDNIKNINIEAFEEEENYYTLNNEYILLSFISVIFIDLGIISFK